MDTSHTLRINQQIIPNYSASIGDNSQLYANQSNQQPQTQDFHFFHQTGKPQASPDQDDEHFTSSRYEEQDRSLEQHSDEEFSEEDEGNIPASSQSESPEDKIQRRRVINEDRMQRVVQDEESQSKMSESGIRYSNMTAGSTFNDQMNNPNVQFERNDRFLIFKMVPQGQMSSVKQSIISNQPTPGIGNKHKQIPMSKYYSETVEDIMSDEDHKDEQSANLYDKLNFNDQSNIDLNESCQDEINSVSQNDIRSFRNHLVNQSSQAESFQQLIKPPLTKQQCIEPFLITNQKSQLTTAQQSQVSTNANRKYSLQPHDYNEVAKQEFQEQIEISRQSLTNIQRQQTIQQNHDKGKYDKQEKEQTKNFFNSYSIQNQAPIQEHSKQSLDNMKTLERRQSDNIKIQLISSSSHLQNDQELMHLGIRKSLTSSSRQQTAQQEASSFAIKEKSAVKNFFNSDQLQNQPLLIEQPKQTLEKIKILERRQSENNAQPSKQLKQQKFFNNVGNSSTNQSNAEKHQNIMTGALDTSSNDPEKDLLLQEYRKLEQIFNKLKNDPQQSSRKGQPPKYGRQQPLDQQKQKSQPNTIKTQKLDDKKSNVKSKKNLKLGGEYPSTVKNNHHLDISNDNQLSMGAYQSSRGIYSQQQSTKAGDGKGKSLFRGDTKQLNREASKNKLSQNQSPNRGSQKPNLIAQHKRHKSKNTKNNKYADIDSDDSLLRSPSSYSSPDKSYRTFQKVQNKSKKPVPPQIKTQVKPKITKKQRQQFLYQQDNQSCQSSECEHCHNDCDCSSCHNDQSALGKDNTYRQDYSREDCIDDQLSESYYDSNDNSRNEIIQNQEYSEQQSQSDQSSCEENPTQNRRKQQKIHNNHQKDKNTHKQGNKNRKLKININMNGAHLSRQAKQDMHNSQEEYFQKQRQLLQQQQMIMAMAQPFNQPQLIVQQQIAMQQQLLLQQQQTAANIQATQLYNLQNANQLGLIDVLSPNTLQQQQQSQLLNQAAPQLQINNVSNNTSIIMKSKLNEGQDQSAKSLLLKNLSENNLNGFPQYKQSTHANYKDQSPSIGGQNSYLISQGPISQMTSPRDQHYYGENSAQEKNGNYLNQLKNKFLIANSNQTDFPSYENQDPTSSRNNKNNIFQANSSPLASNNHYVIADHCKDSFNPATSRRPDPPVNFYDAKSNEYLRKRSDQYEMGGTTGHRHERTYSDMVNQEYQHRYDQHPNQRDERLFSQEKPQFQQNWNFDREPSQFDQNLHINKLKSKKTGDFGKLEESNIMQSPKFIQQNSETTLLFSKAKDASLNNSLKDCDLSMDEGVKASNAHESMHKSPKITNADFSYIQKASELKEQQLPYKRTSLNQVKLQQQKQARVDNESKEQDKKGPQALMIGFDDAKQLKDPFQNKPQLKSRQQIEKVTVDIQRSKSTKGTTPSVGNVNKKLANFAQRRSPDQRLGTGQETAKHSHDKQLRSPITETSKAPTTFHQAQHAAQGQSPVKRIALDLKSINAKQQKQQPIIITNQANDDDEEDIKDPNHNKNIMIEIFDKKGASKNHQLKAKADEVSLAEMFKARRKEAKSQQHQEDQDKLVFKEAHMEEQDEDGKNTKKKEKTKEDLAELRKQMMKSKVKRKEDNFGAAGATPQSLNIGKDGNKKGVEPPLDLQIRLAKGEKVQIDKKEMKQLSKKNYQNLPEIKKKQEEEKKRIEHAARKAAAADYMKQMQDKRKAAILKKKKSVNGGDD